MIKYFIFLFFFPLCFIAAEPPWKEMPPINNDTQQTQQIARVPIPRIDAQSDLSRPRPRSQEIHIHIEEPKDRTNTPAASSEDTEDTIPKHRHNRRMIVSNSVSAIIATLVTAGVTLTVHFTSCKK